MTLGFSRDDIGSFLPSYIEKNVMETDPFKTVDEEGVGFLMEIATKQGRAIKPDLSVGICGEHGGDPATIDFCYRTGLSYVSCSPFRVPVARLAAAQAVLNNPQGKPKTQATDKKPAAKKPVAKKPAAKKPTVKKAADKKSAAKKLTAKKPVIKKAADKKPVAKKPAAKKSAVKKPVVKKAADKKPATKKAPAKKPAIKKVLPKKAVNAKKPVTKKVEVKKAATKKK
jgi:pyruvate,orthophosphate dikinase